MKHPLTLVLMLRDPICIFKQARACLNFCRSQPGGFYILHGLSKYFVRANTVRNYCILFGNDFSRRVYSREQLALLLENSLEKF